MGMAKGIEYHLSSQAWLLGCALLFLVMPVSALAQSTAHHKAVHALRSDDVSITYQPAFKTIPIVAARRPTDRFTLGMPVHYQGKAVRMPVRKRENKVITLKPYAHGENLNRWYALVGAGSGAIILMPDMPTDAQALRLQKRAKIGAAQLGVARDVGGGRVTLGYLRGATRRDGLAPQLSHAKRQSFAALTLMFKR